MPKRSYECSYQGMEALSNAVQLRHGCLIHWHGKPMRDDADDRLLILWTACIEERKMNVGGARGGWRVLLVCLYD